MNPKSGKAGSAISPIDPEKTLEADVADPGEVEQMKATQRQAQSGKYGSVKAEPHKPPQSTQEKDKKRSWIKIKLIDEEQEPVPGELYRITLPDGTIAEGTLDDKGCASVEGFEPGGCKVTFPRLDKKSWKEK
jgi:type VI secretion system secreted protein VgrG